MILIVSNNLDYSTNKVIDWLHYMKLNFKRVNVEDLLSHSSETHFRVGNDEIHVAIQDDFTGEISRYSSIWFRKDSAYQFPAFIYSEINNHSFKSVIAKNLNNEFLNTKDGLFSVVSGDAQVLGNFKKTRINKIEALIIARNCGLEIPKTLITNRKSEIAKFIREQGCIVTKAIGDNEAFFINENDHFVNYTEEITAQHLEDIPEQFYYSLFQEKLDKEIEIRVFFLNNTCYSMAIFSQTTSLTNVDYRKYSNTRNVPYQIHQDLEEKIKKLMASLELNTGSIDIVKTKNGKFVFLEVNPTGQYDMITVRCNYHLDKKIAEFLKN